MRPCFPPACSKRSAVRGRREGGTLALSVGVGLGVLSEMLEEDVDEVVGAKANSNQGRTAVCHGHADGQVTLGGRRIEIRRLRVRTANAAAEVPLQTYEQLHRSRSGRPGGIGADARRRLGPALSAHAGAGR